MSRLLLTLLLAFVPLARAEIKIGGADVTDSVAPVFSVKFNNYITEGYDHKLI